MGKYVSFFNTVCVFKNFSEHKSIRRSPWGYDIVATLL